MEVIFFQYFEMITPLLLSSSMVVTTSEATLVLDPSVRVWLVFSSPGS